MNDTELDHFIDEATTLTKSRNAEASRKFGLGSHSRYELDLDGQTLTFFNEEEAPAVTARIVAVGSLASASESWLWAWENESIPKETSTAMRAVRNFGDQHDVAALQHNFAPCDEALAWSLAAISLKLLGAQAIYRVEQQKTQLFLLLFDLELP